VLKIDEEACSVFHTCHLLRIKCLNVLTWHDQIMHQGDGTLTKWLVKVLWDQVVCCCASSWMQSVGGQQERGGMSDAEQALNPLKSHMPSRAPTCRPSAEPTAVPSAYM
jgi:hypothetical protein